MKTGAIACFASAAAAWIGLASAAEDHSRHQHEPTPLDEHDEHKSVPSQHDDHGQHPAAEAPETHRPPAIDQPTESERAHIPPPPPQLVLGEMSNERMIELMQMEDDAPLGMLLFDQLEWREGEDEDAQVWELQAWYGDDYNKLWFKTQGERIDREEAGSAELLWDRIISPWWSAQAGVRQDFSDGPSRTWASVGIQGLAPYFVEVEAALYIGEEGRTAARLSADHDLLITQRLVLQSALEFELFGKSDPRNEIGSGLSDVEFGLRLRYEILREFAPYVGVHWERKVGRTGELARAAGHDRSDTMAVLGVRIWF